MSNVKKTVKPKKTPVENSQVLEDSTAVKPRKSRAKKIPTKEESLKILSDASSEIKQIIQDLKEEELRVSSMSLKRIPELVKETLSNLDEDLKEIDGEYEQLKLLPDIVSK